jgi:hypothetical protein
VLLNELQEKASDDRRGRPPRIESGVTEKICQCVSVRGGEPSGQHVGEKYRQRRLTRSRVAVQPQNLACVNLRVLIVTRPKPSSQIVRAKYPLAGASSAVTFLAFQSLLVIERVGDK